MAGNRPFGDFLRSRRTRLNPDKVCNATRQRPRPASSARKWHSAPASPLLLCVTPASLRSAPMLQRRRRHHQPQHCPR